MIHRGWLSSLTGKAADAVEMITSGLTAQRSTGSTTFIPGYLSSLAKAYGDLGRFDDAWRSVDEAMTAMRTTSASDRATEVGTSSSTARHMSAKMTARRPGATPKRLT